MAMIADTNKIINSTTTKPITDVTKLDPNKTYDLTAEGYVEHKDPLKEKWYTTFQAAKEIGVTPTSIRNAIHMGKIVTKEIPGKSSTGYIHMISETALTEYLEDPHKVRDEKRHGEYNKKKGVYMRERYHKKEAKKVDIPRPDVVVETNVNLADVMEMERKAHENPIRLEVIFDQIKQMINDAYEKGVADGKLSVEFDKSDEYRRGVEEGKKQAKDELLAMLKGV